MEEAMKFDFAQFDPRPVPAAGAANDAIFASGPVLGIEVTVPALAERCAWGNIDPQHSGGDVSKAAIEVAMSAVIPPEGTILATVKADLDSVGAMAIFSIRTEGKLGNLYQDQNAWYWFEARLATVAMADKFARGGWLGPSPLPTKDNPWPEEASSPESSPALAAIHAAVADFKIPLAERVATMERWLLVGKEPAQYRAQVEKERLDMIAALESGEIRVGLAPCRHCRSHNNTAAVCADCGGAQVHIATVESTHRAALMVGYHLAPVVVALNPEFRLQGGEPHRKFTVCQFAAGYVDLRAALATLAELEPGWGGSPTIIGSPQGVSSGLTIEQVVTMVAKHMR